MFGFRLRDFQPVPAIKLGLTDPVSGLIMGATAEVLADDFGVTRQEQDEYALESHRRACAAQQHCRFGDEIVPTEAAGQLVKQDVGPRAEQSLASLAKLKPFFK